VKAQSGIHETPPGKS